MTTYNTGNPIGSVDVKDLYDNAQNLDELVNNRTIESHPDRLGVPRKTWWGMEQDFQQFLINSGYENIGDYGPGLEITARNQIFRRDGELYRAGAVLDLPYTTTGDWGDEEGLFVAVGDQALRQELSSSSGGDLIGLPGGKTVSDIVGEDGAEMIIGVTSQVSDFNELRAKVGRYQNDQIYLLGHTYPGVGGGRFYWDESSTEADDGGLIAGNEVQGRWIRITNNKFALDNFGADPTGVVNSDSALSLIIDAYPSGNVSKPPVWLGEGEYLFTDSHTVPQGKGLYFCMAGTGFNTSRIRYEGAGDVFLTVEDESAYFRDLRAFSEPLTPINKIFLDSPQWDGAADVDVIFQGCFFGGWRAVHRCVGRGSVNNDCTLVKSNCFSYVVSPDPFVDGPNSGIQNTYTGMRRYSSNNLMVDDCTAVFEFSEDGPAAKYMNEVSIIGLHGVLLGCIINGGHLSQVTIKTGVLVSSGSLGAIRVGSLKSAVLDINMARSYGQDIPVGSTQQVNYLIDVRTPGLTPSTEVLLSDVTISGSVHQLGNGLIRCYGRAGNIVIDRLSLSNAFESNASTNVAFVDVRGGFKSGCKVLIDNVAMDSRSFDGNDLYWNLPANAGSTLVGQYVCTFKTPILN